MDTNKTPLQLGKLGPLLSGQNLIGDSFNNFKKRESKQDRYRKLMRGVNILSYSTLSGLHECELKFKKTKLDLSVNQNTPVVLFSQSNIDFAFGRAVETGVHSVLLGKSSENVFMDMLLSWDIPIWDEHPKKIDKSFLDALIAIEKFKVVKEVLFDGWEVAVFNGNPAIELSMCIDLGETFYYIGHCDIVLYNKNLNRYRVLELKTTGAKNLHPAMYQNSAQAVGYSIPLDTIAKDLDATTSYEVFYLVFWTTTNEWQKFDFVKNRSARAGWINTLLLDVHRIKTYKQADFFPKRDSCFNYGKPCKYFGICELEDESELEILSEEEIREYNFDFYFNLKDIIQTQVERV